MLIIKLYQSKHKFFILNKYSCSNLNKIYLKDNNNEVKSFWRDISLREGLNYNMVVEIPAKSRICYEMATSEENNPIKIKPPKPIPSNTNFPVRIRNYDEDPLINYGFLPQTYSSKHKIYRNLYSGDGDPLDVIEVSGPFNKHPGDIIQVTLLGSFCLIDQGEVDWKIIVGNVDTYDPKIDYKDIITYTMKWFKIYKSFFGKKENEILENNRFFDINETISIIEECNDDYKSLIKNL
jgi:inorganic pyrophosphatase